MKSPTPLGLFLSTRPTIPIQTHQAKRVLNYATLLHKSSNPASPTTIYLPSTSHNQELLAEESAQWNLRGAMMASSEQLCMHLCSLFLFFVSGQLAGQLDVAAAAAAAPRTAPPVGNISKVDDAQLFHIYYGQSFKVIKNSIDGKSYLLMQSNSRMATRTKYCTGRIKSFVIPLSNYSVDATSFPVSFFEMLGLLDNLKGLTSYQVTSLCILKSLTSGAIQLVNKTDMQALSQFTAHFISNVDEERSCNFAAFVPLDERTPLQRSEWIKYLATFTNSEVRANSVYDAVKANYNCLVKAAANNTDRFKPVVAWVDYNQGIWSFAKEGYKLQYVRDAGAENIDDTLSNNSYNVSDPEDMDNFHAILCTVDVLIDQTYVPEPAEYKLSTFLENIDIGDNSCYGFLTNQSLWRYDKRVQKTGSIDWHDGAISQPQLVLADLMEAFFPTGNYNTTYFRNLAKDEGVTMLDPESCDRSPSTPMDPTIIPCQ